MSKEKTIVIANASKGVGFAGILFIVLLLLKVGVIETQVTQWSWWIIFAPFWAAPAIVLSIVVIILCLCVVVFIGYVLFLLIRMGLRRLKKDDG